MKIILFAIGFGMWTSALFSQDISSKHSERLDRMRRAWTAWVEAEDRDAWGKTLLGRRYRAMSNLIEEAPAGFLDAEITRRSATSGVLKEVDIDTVIDEFDEVLLQCMVSILIERRDRTRLQRLLAANCPSSIGLHPLESYGSSAMGCDFLILLTEVWPLAKNEARTTITSLLASSFKNIRKAHPEMPEDTFGLASLASPLYISEGDRLFVAACAQFLRTNRSQLVLNKDYLSNSLATHRKGDLFYLGRVTGSGSGAEGRKGRK